MYHSYPLYTGNMGLSNCILGMSNLAACVHMHMKYGTIWKIISTRKFNLKFCLLVRTFWQLGKMSEFHVVCDESVLILFVCVQDRPKGLERSRKVGFLGEMCKIWAICSNFLEFSADGQKSEIME